MSEIDIHHWTAAFIANTRKIEQHPLFPRLVREVAVAEAPRRFTRLARNSPTYGAWAARQGARVHGERQHGTPRTGPNHRRAYLLAERVAVETGILSESRMAERQAAVYVAARYHVRHRSSGRDL